jgi:hypothetical protein
MDLRIRFIGQHSQFLEMSSNDRGGDMGKLTLAVSFQGPFIFDFQRDSVVVYAPQCEGHFASVLSDFEEIGMATEAPQKSYEYIFDEQNRREPRRTGTSLVNRDAILIVDSARRRAKVPGPGDCQFVLQIPRPDQLNGLVADPISILQYDLDYPGNGLPAPAATSMRFNYHNIEDTSVWELSQSNTGTSVLKLPIKAAPPANYVQLTFRYSSGIPQKGHKDAAQCFQEMRNLFPPFGAWKVVFPDPRLDNHLNDCHAAQIVFAQDDEIRRWEAHEVSQISQ